ncbi:uncharacterized protein LOC142289829 [Anomaloglossus baeobatrachus]|uniref:uncharacterized protein LOC142289829 n=1 Tax=Anomaloglossus baeobatrachus TaxID=238106 RepID=UPI003F50AA9E
MEPANIDVDVSPAVVEPPAAVRSGPKRMHLTCPVCYIVTDRLDKHLQRQCMKHNSAEERTATLTDARDTLRNIASKGTTMEYEDILALKTPENTISFLEERGYLILHKPTAASTVQVQEQQDAGASSTYEAPVGECEEETEVVQERESASTVPSCAHSNETAPYKEDSQRLPVETEQEDPSTSGLMQQENSPVCKVKEFEEVIVGSPALTVPERMDLEASKDFPVVEDSSEDQSDEEDKESSGEESAVSAEEEQESAEEEQESAEEEQESAEEEQESAEEEQESAEQEQESAEQEQESAEQEQESAVSSDEDMNRVLKIKWTGLKQKMKQAGLYKRFKEENPVLKGFEDYLKKNLSVRKVNQEVADVSRFLYYMNNDCVSLDFVKDIKKAQSFFVKLREVGLSSQTACNYLKHLKRFVRYQLRETNLAHENPQLYKAFKIFKGVTKDIQTMLAKGVSQEVVSNRFDALTSSHLPPAHYLKILEVAKPSFLKSLRHIKSGGKKREHQFNVLNYLETLLVLKHGQRPGVIKNFTVSEWTRRLPYGYEGQDFIVIGVKAHKTSAQQVACFALTPTEEEWLKVYFEKLRPNMVKPNSGNTFFLNSSGEPIHNVSNDLMRYHKKFGLPLVTSKMIRKVNYRENTLENICHGHSLVLRSWNEEMQEAQASTSRAGLGSPPDITTRSRAAQSLKRSSSSTEEPRTSRPRMDPVVLLKRLPNL